MTEQSADTNGSMELLKTLSVYALVRTAFSSERSVQSWIRTSCSLYSFGFSLIKFLDFVEQQGETQFSNGPRFLGLSLIGIGMLVVVMAVIDHRRRLNKMRTLGLPGGSSFSLPVIASAGMLVVGLATVIAIALNWPG